RPGTNRLLVKIVNYQGEAGFYFKVASPQTIIPGDIYELARRPSDKRTSEEQQRLREFFRNNVADAPELKSLQSELAAKREASLAIDREIATTLVWREKKEPVPPRILLRAEYDQPGDQVERRTPAFL